MTKSVDKCNLQGVDTAINDFSLTPKRLRYVTFTQPFMTDEFAVYQAYDDPWAIRVLKLFCFQYLPVVLGILVFGLLLGALVYTLVKRETQHRNWFVCQYGGSRLWKF